MAEPNPMVSCGCGCGATFAKYDAHRRPRAFVLGHHIPQNIYRPPSQPPRPIPVIIATTPADLAFQAERAATRYIALNRPTARARLVVIVRELDPDELDRR